MLLHRLLQNGDELGGEEGKSTDGSLCRPRRKLPALKKTWLNQDNRAVSHKFSEPY